MQDVGSVCLRSVGATRFGQSVSETLLNSDGEKQLYDYDSFEKNSLLISPLPMKINYLYSPILITPYIFLSNSAIIVAYK